MPHQRALFMNASFFSLQSLYIIFTLTSETCCSTCTHIIYFIQGINANTKMFMCAHVCVCVCVCVHFSVCMYMLLLSLIFFMYKVIIKYKYLSVFIVDYVSLRLSHMCIYVCVCVCVCVCLCVTEKEREREPENQRQCDWGEERNKWNALFTGIWWFWKYEIQPYVSADDEGDIHGGWSGCRTSWPGESIPQEWKECDFWLWYCLFAIHFDFESSGLFELLIVCAALKEKNLFMHVCAHAHVLHAHWIGFWSCF